MRIGIDMGGTSIKIGLVNQSNVIVDKKVIETRVGDSEDQIIESMITATKQLIKANQLSLSDCEGIGIGTPGTIDKQGMVMYSNNYNWKNVPLCKKVEEMIGNNIVVKVANDADTAAMGEIYAGSAKDLENVVLITLGTGVGSGVIINKKIFSGPLTGGCEIGHMVIKNGGKTCTCGRKGCFEAYASATALIDLARNTAKMYPESKLNDLCKNDLTVMNGKIPFEAGRAGDIAAQKVLEEYIENLACGLVNVVNIFRPEKIILGGGIAGQGKYLTAPVQKLVNQACFGEECGQVPQIVVSKLGNDAGIIGAACLVI